MTVTYYEEGVRNLITAVGLDVSTEIVMKAYEKLFFSDGLMGRGYQLVLDGRYGIEDYSNLESGNFERRSMSPKEMSNHIRFRGLTEKIIMDREKKALEKMRKIIEELKDNPKNI